MTISDVIVMIVGTSLISFVALSTAPNRARVREMASLMTAIVFYGPGYAAGALVRFVRWARAAIIAGYKDGRGAI